MRESFGIFQHNQREFVGWLLMLSPVTVCQRDGFKQMTGFSACCQLHAVKDCLDHSVGDNMSAEDHVTCSKAREFLLQGRGVGANGARTLPPDHAIDNEVEQ